MSGKCSCCDFSGPVAALTPPSGKSLLANAAEELCFHYAKTSKIQVKVFRLPYLYAVSESGTEQFARLFEQMPTGTVQMDEQAAQPLLALCMEELADLTARVFDTWTPEPERFLLPQVFDATQRQVGEVLQKLQPGLEVCYGADTLQTYPTDDHTVRRGTAGSSGTVCWTTCPPSTSSGRPARPKKRASSTAPWTNSARAPGCSASWRY